MGRFSRSSRFTILLSLLVFTALLTSCGSREVCGKIKKISQSAITIQTGNYQFVSDAGKDRAGANAAAGADVTAAEANEKAADGFLADGGTADYALSADIDSSDLPEGACVKLTLEEDTVVAIEILSRPDAGTDGSQAAGSQPKETQQKALLHVDDPAASAKGKSYSTSKPNTNTILVEHHGSLDMRGSTLTKSGNTTDESESRLHGLNAVLIASQGSSASLSSTTLTSSGTGASGLFSTGEHTKIDAKNITIQTTGNFSSGLDATYGGLIHAKDADITTQGSDSPAIAANEKGGTIEVTDTAISTEGESSPCILAAGKVEATSVTGGASQSGIALIKNSGHVTLRSCILQGADQSGILIQGKGIGNCSLKTVDSQLTITSNEPMLTVDSCCGLVVMERTTLYYSSHVLAKVSGVLALKGIQQVFKGDILCEPDSCVKLNFTKGTRFQGTVNSRNAARSVSVSIDADSTWNVTGNSYVGALKNKDKQCQNIHSNGHTIYYDPGNKDNSWLKHEILSLPGGGKLSPVS